MQRPKLTRSPRVTYLWMVISILFVITFFARWESFVRSGQMAQWWAIVCTFLVADFFFLIIPIQDGNSIRRLRAVGRIWALVAWGLVLIFLMIVVPSSGTSLRREHPLISTGAGLVILIALVWSIFRLSGSWVRESLRSIVARPGGGFLIYFPGDDAVEAALSRIAGAQREAGLDAWSVPAAPDSAAALVQFAKQHDFDFVPQKSKAVEGLSLGG